MINTYQTSMAPPPVPPRHSGSHQVLIPTPLPSKGYNKALLQFLVAVVLLHLFLSIGGFFFLLHQGKLEKFQRSEEGAVSLPSSEKQTDPFSQKQHSPLPVRSDRAMAHVVVDRGSLVQKDKDFPAGFLQWDIKHSDLRNISSFYKNRLTILRSGKYFVYSKVTFSKAHPNQSLVSWVTLRKSEKGEDQVKMKAYCQLDSSNGPTPSMCTASQQGLLTLEEGNQLGVWVQDRNLVDYEDGATVFGMYEL